MMKTPMLTDKECVWLERIEKEVDRVWDDLTAWEKMFIEGLLERFRKYGDKTIISKDQWARITEVSEKII